MYKDLGLQLISGASTPQEVRDIMKKCGFEDEVCKIGLKKLKLNKWTEPELLALMQESGYKEEISYACAPYLTLSDKTNQEIFSLLAATKNNWKIVDVAVKALKLEQENEETILSLMSSSNNDEIYKLSRPFLKLETKSEPELMKLLARLNYSQEAGPLITPYLKQPENLLAMLEQYKEEYCADTRQICIAGLKLSEKNETELMILIKMAKYNLFVCTEAIKFLKDLANILFVLIKIKFDHRACANALSKLPSDDHIMTLWEMHQFSTEVTLTALPLLKEEENINAIWKSQGHYDEIRLMILACLPLANKSEDELAVVIKKDQYHDDAARVCLPYLQNLIQRDKSGQEIMRFLKKTGYNEGACKLLFPPAKLKKMTEKEIFSLLRESGFPENVGKFFAPFLTTEEYVIRLVREASYQENYWIKPFSKLLQQKKNDQEIMAVLNYLYGAAVNGVAIGFLHEKENIIKLMEQSSEQKLKELGLKRLAELAGKKSGKKTVATKA